MLKGSLHDVDAMRVRACASQLRRGRPGSFAVRIGQGGGVANAQEMPYSQLKKKKKKRGDERADGRRIIMSPQSQACGKGSNA